MDDYEKSNALLSDIILNYRTVMSFGQENVDQINAKFKQLLEEPQARRVRNFGLAGLANGWSSCSRVAYIGAAYLAGNYISVDILELDKYMVLGATFMLFYAFMTVGGSATNIPSVQKAKAAAKDVFSVIDEKSTLDVREQNEDTIHEVGPGMIQFKQVTFNYPTRAAKVLDDFNMKIPAGAKIALVGHSGCGKSTITNLLLRFYDIKSGKIKIDGEDLEDYNALSLRKQIGYVMQEPILFNKTIKENILYGKLDATDEEIYKAALNANALGFIEAGQGDLTAEEIKKDHMDQLERRFE